MQRGDDNNKQQHPNHYIYITSIISTTYYTTIYHNIYEYEFF